MNSTRYVASLAAIGILLLAAVSAFMSLRNTPSNLAVTTSSVLKPRLTMTDNTYTVKVPIREKHTKTINYTVMSAVREQRSKDVTYTVTEIVREQRTKTDPKTGSQYHYTVALPVQKQKTKTINYTVNLMVPEQRKKTLEYHTVRYETLELPRN